MRWSLLWGILLILVAYVGARPIEIVRTLQVAEANTSQKGKGNKENVGVDISQLQGTVGAVLDVLSADKSPLALLG